MSMKMMHEDVMPTTPGWRGRAAVTVTNGQVEATLLPGGGHLARWGFCEGHGPSQENLLWEAPWETADPCSAAHAAIAEGLGDEEAGEYLASYTGHVLCLDGFGPASAADAAAGVSLHGEAPNATWTFAIQGPDRAVGSAELPVAGLKVERQFWLGEGESVLRVEERVSNLRDAERNLHWVQHATFGVPAGASGGGRATASVQDGITSPKGYDGDHDRRNLLARDERFTWPYAPGKGGAKADLRELFSQSEAGFIAATRQKAGREHGFVAVCYAEIGLAVGYVFRVEDFPWLAIWEENRARCAAPWSGQVQARGMEFGTTPLPLGNEAVDARGPLFGNPTSRRIAAHETLRAPWMMFVASVPPDWQEVEEVRVEKDQIVLVCGAEQVGLSARGAADFFAKG
jgi:hypothetical protein